MFRLNRYLPIMKNAGMLLKGGVAKADLYILPDGDCEGVVFTFPHHPQLRVIFGDSVSSLMSRYLAIPGHA